LVVSNPGGMERVRSMARRTVGWAGAGLWVLCLSSWAMADAEAEYKMLFGQDEAKVAASRNTKDAAAFAAKLLNAAKSVGDQKDLQALLCEKAYEFGLKDPSGQQTGVEALKLLGEAAPDKKAQAQERLLKVMQSRFAKSTGAERKRLGEELVDLLVSRGDQRAEAKAPAEAAALYRQALSIATGIGAEQTKEIMDKIKGISSALEAEKKLADLKAKLEADPKNTAVRTSLILAYLGELDNPVEGAKLVNGDLDEKLRTYVPLAAKPLADLDEAACLELAYWYAELAEKAPPADKGILLGRAKACCERYLSLHTAQDVNRLKATLLLEKVGKGANSTPKNAQPPKKQIPTDAKRFGKSWYLLVSETMPYQDASKWCEDRGGHLAYTRTEAEYRFIEKVARQANADLWLGGYYDSETQSCFWNDDAKTEIPKGILDPEGMKKTNNHNKVFWWKYRKKLSRDPAGSRFGFICQWD